MKKQESANSVNESPPSPPECDVYHFELVLRLALGTEPASPWRVVEAIAFHVGGHVAGVAVYDGILRFGGCAVAHIAPKVLLRVPDGGQDPLGFDLRTRGN